MEKKRIGLVAIILIFMIAGTSAWAEGEETVRKQQKDEAAVLADTEPVEEKTEQAKLKKRTPGRSRRICHTFGRDKRGGAFRH